MALIEKKKRKKRIKLFQRIQFPIRADIRCSIFIKYMTNMSIQTFQHARHTNCYGLHENEQTSSKSCLNYSEFVFDFRSDKMNISRNIQTKTDACICVQ